MRALYEHAGIRELTGLSLEEFTRSPKQALAQAGQEDAPAILASGFRPLLPSQARLRARLDAGDAMRDAEPMASPPERATAGVTSLRAFRHRRRMA